MNHDYNRAIKRLQDLGVMTNASFVFGMDHDDETVFDRTVEWAIGQGVETSTFHILTPYPGTALYDRMSADGRITTHKWDLYDTRHAIYQPAKMTAEALETGYWKAYRDFYRWGAIFKGAAVKPNVIGKLRHLAYAGGWKKFEPLWDMVIRIGQVSRFLPVLETVLAGNGKPKAPPAGLRLTSQNPKANGTEKKKRRGGEAGIRTLGGVLSPTTA